MKRFVIIFSLVVLFFILKTLYQAGQYKTITNHFAGTVTEVYRNMPGTEDMQMDFSSRNLYISSSARRVGSNHQKDGIYRINMADTGNPKKLITDYQGEFHPHGISLFRKDTTLYLMAVNHNSEGNFIETFYCRNDTLFHQNTYGFKELCCPNDVVAVDNDKFYVTNDHGAKKGFMRILEDYFKIPRSNLFYFDGQQLAKAAGPYNYANGVNVSADGEHLFMSTTTGNEIYTFERLEDGSLKLRFTQDLATGADNIDVDNDGNLWIAAHPKLINFIRHAKDSTVNSPSQVLKLSLQDNHSFAVEEVYLNDGSEISGSSIAVFYENTLFIGNVFDSKVLRANLAD